jgi:protein-disulfide isomerase
MLCVLRPTPEEDTAMSRNVAIVLAALVLAASVVTAGVLVRQPLDRGVEELASLRAEVAGLEEAVKAGSAAPARQAARPNQPDPSQRYEVKTDGSPALGSESAKVEIVEFSDFQCPFCSRVTPTLKQIHKEYGDQVRIVFKHLPLSIHPKAPDAHAAAEAAHRQGKFWEMHDAIFGNQREMTPEKYVEYAKQLGLDVERFKLDVAAAEVKQRVEADAQEAARLNVRGTPGFFINGRYLSGAQPFEAFKQRIDEELGAKQVADG